MVLSLALALGAAVAFTPAPSLGGVQRVSVLPSALVMSGGGPPRGRPGAKVKAKAAGSAAKAAKFTKQGQGVDRPDGLQMVAGRLRKLGSPTNYPATSAKPMIQKNGFGNFVGRFEKASSTKASKYGMPVFLPNGNINPAYLAAERTAMRTQKKMNIKASAARTKKLNKAGLGTLGDYIARTKGANTNDRASGGPAGGWLPAPTFGDFGYRKDGRKYGKVG